MISNQYQNQVSFKGNLLKQGINLPEKAFSEAAKIYAEKTKGKPDLTLIGRMEHNDAGQFYHATTVYRGNDDIADILSSSLKDMFARVSPKKIAEDLVNISRKADPEDKANILKKEINDTKKRLMTIKLQLEQNQPADVEKNLKVIKSRMEASIAAKEKQYEKIKPTEPSWEWCI